MIPAFREDDPVALDGIRILVQQSAAGAAPDHSPLSVFREGNSFWVQGSRANCEWARGQIGALLQRTAHLSLAVVEVADKTPASVDAAVQIIKTVGPAAGHGALTAVHYADRLLL